MRSVRNCKVCVVGGAGFLGSHMVEHLLYDRNCEVTVFDNLCVGRREFIPDGARFVHGDIAESEHRLRNVFAGMQYIFNYAAWPYIPDSFARPLHVFEVNATGALKVINAAQDVGVEGILQVSSAEIYGQHDAKDSGTVFSKIREDALVFPHSSYGAAKAAIDAMVQVRWKEAQTPCIALRQFNCVGERETHPYIVPEIISQLSECKYQHRMINRGIVKLGNNSFRDFLYAKDAVRMAVFLMERGAFGEVYNLGSETGIKIYDLAKLIGKLMGFSEVVVEQDPARVRPWEIWHLQSDNSKLLNAIAPTVPVVTSLEDALKHAIVDYNTNGRKWVWE